MINAHILDGVHNKNLFLIKKINKIKLKVEAAEN